MKFILGKKLNMTQVWQNGDMVAVTKVQAGPCTVAQIKDEKKDKYTAVQVGFGEKKKKNMKKPQLGHLKGLGNFRYLREFRVEAGDLKRGDVVSADTFAPGDKINVSGISKGKGFQGVVKRHGFKGTKKTHGNKDQLRMPGSIGATGPAHVFKGQRMPGHMGDERVTITNLEIIEVDKKNNILLIKGAVPGSRNGLLLISGPGELVVKNKAVEEEKSGSKKEADMPEEKKTEEKKDAKQNAETKQSSSNAKEKTPEPEPETPEEVEKKVIEAKEKVDKKADVEKKSKK